MLWELGQVFFFFFFFSIPNVMLFLYFCVGKRSLPISLPYEEAKAWSRICYTYHIQYNQEMVSFNELFNPANIRAILISYEPLFLKIIFFFFFWLELIYKYHNLNSKFFKKPIKNCYYTLKYLNTEIKLVLGNLLSISFWLFKNYINFSKY